MIVHNVEEGQYTEDEEVLNELLKTKRRMHGIERDVNMVQIVTDDYSSWNRLKSHLLLNPHDFSAQLKINENALRSNPKSYQAWHHRNFMMKHFPDEKKTFLQREDLLTGLLLESDPRNFHCWNYRMTLFGREKSQTGHDLFNYSYLHHHLGDYDPLALIYTDPLDPTGWEYLYVCREQKRTETGVYLRRYPAHVEIRFKDPFSGKLTLMFNGIEMRVFQDLPTTIISVENTTGILENCRMKTQHFEMDLGLFEEDISFIHEILGLEPKCHYALLALLDYTEEEAERKRLIRNIIELDPTRRSYYNSLIGALYSVYIPKG